MVSFLLIGHVDFKFCIRVGFFSDKIIRELDICKIPNDLFTVTGGRVNIIDDKLLVASIPNSAGVTLICNIISGEKTYLHPKANKKGLVKDYRSYGFIQSN